MPNAAGEIVRREFSQHYTVIAPPTGATVAADLMNVLYAGYDNPISVSASGISSDKIHLSMSGGTLNAKGNGKYVARPAHVGQDVTFTVTGEVGGKPQTMGAFSFKVRKLPDPAAFITIGGDQFRGGRIGKGNIVGATRLDAAIDDGLLNIPFTVRSFECVSSTVSAMSSRGRPPVPRSPKPSATSFANSLAANVSTSAISTP